MFNGYALTKALEWSSPSVATAWMEWEGNQAEVTVEATVNADGEPELTITTKWY